MSVIMSVLASAPAMSTGALAGPGTASAWPPPVEQPAARRADDGTIKVLSTRSWIEDGDLSVVAHLRNKTRKWRTHVRGELTLYTKSGKSLGSHVVLPEQLVVPPRGQLFLKGFEDFIPAGYHHYRLTFTSDQAKPGVKHLKVTVGDVGLDPDIGGLNVPVTIRNNNDFTVKHVFASVALFDAGHRILNVFNGYNYTDPSKLRPGKAGSITLYFGSHFEGVKTLTVIPEAGR